VVVAARRPASGVEVACDHDADRLDPAGNVEDRPEAALGEDVVLIVGILPRSPPRGGVAVLDAEVLEPLVILVAASGDRSKVVASRTMQAARTRPLAADFARAPASPPSPSPTAVGAVGRRVPRPGRGPFTGAAGVTGRFATASIAPASAAALARLAAIPRPCFTGRLRPFRGSRPDAVAGGQRFVVTAVIAGRRPCFAGHAFPIGGALTPRPPTAATTPPPPPRAARAVVVAGVFTGRFTASRGRRSGVFGMLVVPVVTPPPPVVAIGVDEAGFAGHRAVATTRPTGFPGLLVRPPATAADAVVTPTVPVVVVIVMIVMVETRSGFARFTADRFSPRRPFGPVTRPPPTATAPPTAAAPPAIPVATLVVAARLVGTAGAERISRLRRLAGVVALDDRAWSAVVVASAVRSVGPRRTAARAALVGVVATFPPWGAARFVALERPRLRPGLGARRLDGSGRSRDGARRGFWRGGQPQGVVEARPVARGRRGRRAGSSRFWRGWTLRWGRRRWGLRCGSGRRPQRFGELAPGIVVVGHERVPDRAEMGGDVRSATAPPLRSPTPP